MKILKTVLVTLIALLLTGCYTQLQYSKTVKKDKKEARGYSWSGEEQADEQVQNESEYADYEDDEIPIYYKDYEYARRYDDCGCSPYNVYNFYGYDGFGYPYYSYGSFFSLNTYYFHKWHYRRHFYPGFAFSFSWGWPYSYHSFYDPFYDYYWYGYRPYAFNYIYYYGGSGHGYGYYPDGKRRSNTRYGPRSIGTNRVVGTDDRSRDPRLSGRDAARVGSTTTVRSRSGSVTRSRGTVNRSNGSTVRTRSRSDNKSGGSTRTRSRGNDMQSNDSRIYIDRTRDSQVPARNDRDGSGIIRTRSVNLSNSSVRSIEDRSDIRARLQRAPNVEFNAPRERSRHTFFDRMKTFFQQSTSRIRTDFDRSNSTIRTRSRSSSNSSSINRRSSQSRSSVDRSRSSSSNNSRSRGSSSSSRSRSGGNSSSGSERSRGNN